MVPRRKRRPRYTGEDTRLTSKQELRGWYAYGLAAEVFAVCGVGSFLPVTLEQLARERGVLRSDGVTPCISTTPDKTGPGVKQALLLLARNLQQRDDSQCVIRLFGAEVNTSSFALYTFSLAVGVQALTLVSISAIADHGANRKLLLSVLGFTGAVSCMMFLLVFPSIYLVGPLLVVISVTCLGSSFVLLNSFLPLLVSNHPSVVYDNNDGEVSDGVPLTPFRIEDIDIDSDDFEELDTTAIVNSHKEDTQSNTTSPELKLSNQISSKGVGIGYAAAVSVQIISIIILVIFSKVSPALSKTSLPMRIVLFLVGLWWATFTVPMDLWLRRRPGPPLPSHIASGRRWFTWLSYIAFAWSSLWRTIKLAAQLKQVFIFLIAWFLLSDAIATVSGTAILFARTELKMSTASIALISITATTSGILGAFTWPFLARRSALSTTRIIILCILLFELIPLYGLLGFVPFIKRLGVFGLQQPWEIFPLAVVHGFVMGGLSSYCRSFYGVLIPPGMEAAFYALYAVTDKGSSVVGPAVVGRIVDKTGSIRAAFWFLAPLILAPVPLVWWVDAEQGRKEALEMSGRKDGWKNTAIDDANDTHDGAEEREGLMNDVHDS